MAPKNFPLRWESTGDQWWFASPIDYAAANGHYELVKELLHMDANLLIKLTSLPRIRRLETVWDDDESFNNVAKCRSQIAQKLLQEGHNALIRAGYGGWLLYTAASAGDLMFVKELLGRDPHLVFGEGEYGVTDILYAAARGRSCEVFRAVFDCCLELKGRETEVLRWEIVNRAAHAAARGGSVEMLREILGGGSDVLGYRDALGSTLLHTASGRGQVEVVKYLISSHDDIITSVDNRGNTALHIAAYRAHLPVLEILTSASPSATSSTNNHGDTFLHTALSGFQTPGFKRLDHQINLMKKLIGGTLVKIDDIINIQNHDGKTALHIAVIDENIHTDIAELLMSVRYIDFNVCDNDGNTPLDLLRQRPRSPSSEILIKRLVSSGGISEQTAGNVFSSNTRITHGIGGSPGTSFKIPDAELFEDVYTRPSSCDFTSTTDYNYSGEIEHIGPNLADSISSKYKKSSSMNNSATWRLKTLFRFLPGKNKRNTNSFDLGDSFSAESNRIFSGSKKNGPVVPLRQQFSLPNNKRILSLQGYNFPSPSSKKKFAAGLTKSGLGSPSSVFSESPWSSPLSADMRSGEIVNGGSKSRELGNYKLKGRRASFNSRLMNNYFCFGAQALAVENSINDTSGEIRNRRGLVV